MLILEMFFEATNKNSLLGKMPESLGLLLFGIGLIVFAISLRWFFNRGEETAKEDSSARAQNMPRELFKLEN